VSGAVGSPQAATLQHDSDVYTVVTSTDTVTARYTASLHAHPCSEGVVTQEAFCLPLTLGIAATNPARAQGNCKTHAALLVHSHCLSSHATQTYSGAPMLVELHTEVGMNAVLLCPIPLLNGQLCVHRRPQQVPSGSP
jgi:hypothetical protein